MKIEASDLVGLYVVEQDRHVDARGYFARTWCVDEFEQLGLTSRFLQSSISYNRHDQTLRGMHLQLAPYEETKLIRCQQGAAFDVVIDLRADSPTYMKWQAFELSFENGLSLYVPPGFAHGFQTLTPDTVMSYDIDKRYQPSHATGVRWDDSAFGIQWPRTDRRVISDKDCSWPDYDPSIGLRPE